MYLRSSVSFDARAQRARRSLAAALRSDPSNGLDALVAISELADAIAIKTQNGSLIAQSFVEATTQTLNPKSCRS